MELYEVVQVSEETWELRQADRRHAGGDKGLATGNQASMEQLKKWHERERKGIFRLKPDLDDELEALKESRGWNKQFMFTEAIELWLAFARDPERLEMMRGVFSAGQGPWGDGAADLCRDYVEGRVAWIPPDRA